MTATDYGDLQYSLNDYIKGKDARIGVCLLIDNDTVQINGRKEFPMLSVYKFPLALNVSDKCMANGISFQDTILVNPAEIKSGTWSPLREKYGIRSLKIPLSELVSLTLQQSDNNACDILFSRFGGPASADSLMKSYGYNDIHILDTEAQMHESPSLCYRNRATPLQISSLFRKFHVNLRWMSKEFQDIAEIIENCDTGNKRIPAGLPQGCTIGHKTGTGDINHDGRISAVNDAGYIVLPDNRNLYLTIMISYALCTMQEAESYIEEITKIIASYLLR